MAKADLTAQRLREVLSYNPETGVFVWLKPTGRRAKAGQNAGCLCKTHGYIELGVDGVSYPAHRLAWLYVNGEWPKHDIDHMNGQRSDNRIANLRDVTRSINMQNMRKAKSNSRSGLLGVEWHGASSLWQARIKAGGVKHCLGYFRDKHEAHAAYLAAKRRLHEGCTI